ncbi:hypothetical protein ACFL2X_06145 [Candidatus Latescibacterota bacterium]
MKRRKAMQAIPLSIAGVYGFTRSAFGKNMCENKACADKNGSLAMGYRNKIIERLTWVRENQSESLMEAAYAIARTYENGGQCYQVSWDAGHSEADSWAGRNGEPEIFSTAYNADKLKKGDLILTCAQIGDAAVLKKKGVFIIGCPSSWSGDARYPELLREEIQLMRLKPHADLWIENNATSLGGVVLVPGMPAPIGPVSGCMGKVTIWMMLADACRILARRGIKVPVKGDEPKITGENIDYRNFSGWVDLNTPLMDDYFNEIMNQMELITAETGTIKKIAAMCVDSVLNGGKIYGYSLHNSVAGEASTRRSGLSITRGVDKAALDTAEKRKNFGGTSKDCVIMGITKPDDEFDLTALDLFKKRGMKVASIGAMTRSHAKQTGRKVYDETLYHAGKMCDTYGLFAVPGFEQRICPTSGVLLDQLYWSTMMEVVEQYIERTGDVPGVYLSGALKGGMEHLYRMNELYSGNEY